MLYFVQQGLRLDFLWASDQRFLGDLFAIVTSLGPIKPEELDFLLDCALHHTRVMVRISRHVAVNVKLLAKCGELDTKFFVETDGVAMWPPAVNR